MTNGKKIKDGLRIHWKTILEKVITVMAIGACFWMVSKTKDFVAFANDLPDTLDTIVESDAHQDIKIAEFDSLFVEIKNFMARPDTVQQQILEGINKLLGENPQ